MDVPYSGRSNGRLPTARYMISSKLCHLKNNDTLLILDRYYDYSIKSVIMKRENRNVNQSNKQVKVAMGGPAHDRNVV